MKGGSPLRNPGAARQGTRIYCLPPTSSGIRTGCQCRAAKDGRPADCFGQIFIPRKRGRASAIKIWSKPRAGLQAESASPTLLTHATRAIRRRRTSSHHHVVAKRRRGTSSRNVVTLTSKGGATALAGRASQRKFFIVCYFIASYEMSRRLTTCRGSRASANGASGAERGGEWH